MGSHVLFERDVIVEALDEETDEVCTGSVAPCCAGLVEEGVEIFGMDCPALTETFAPVGAPFLEGGVKIVVG